MQSSVGCVSVCVGGGGGGGWGVTEDCCTDSMLLDDGLVTMVIGKLLVR